MMGAKTCSCITTVLLALSSTSALDELLGKAIYDVTPFQMDKELHDVELDGDASTANATAGGSNPETLAAKDAGEAGTQPDFDGYPASVTKPNPIAHGVVESLMEGTKFPYSFPDAFLQKLHFRVNTLRFKRFREKGLHRTTLAGGVPQSHHL